MRPMVPRLLRVSSSVPDDLVTAPFDSPAEVLQQLGPQEREQWDSCRSLLRDAGMPSDDVIDRALARGFAWTSRWYYGQERQNDLPDPSNLLDSLTFLQSLGIQGEDLVKVLSKFPEALSCSVDERMGPNVARLESEWSMKGEVLKRAIVRKPTLLGLSI